MNGRSGKTLHIRWIRQEDGESKSRIVCGIDETSIVGGMPSTESKEVYFEVGSEYSLYLVSERADAFVVLLLRYALFGSYDIRSDVPMSDDLYHNIKERLLPPLVKNGGYDVSITAPLVPPLPRGTGVGTGMSCGVDALHALMKYSEYPIHRFRLTHLCVYNLGSFDAMHTQDSIEKVREGVFSRARKVSEEVGIPLVETDSNANSVFYQNHMMAHSFTSAFAIFCLRKLWRCYYYASSGVDHSNGWSLKSFLARDSSNYEDFLFSCLSTSGLEIVSEGGTLSRTEKISDLAGYPAARKHLHSCMYSADNCSRCDKCARNLLSLDLLGKLDQFSEVYDVEFYRSHRSRYFWYLRNRREARTFSPIYSAFHASGDPEFRSMEKVANLVDRFDELWAKGDPAADAKAVGLLLPYRNVDHHATYRLADAYATGRGAEKSPQDEADCLRFVADHYRKEISEGFVNSGIRLFDILWRTGDSDGELMEAILPEVNLQRSYAMARMSKMYAEGRGAEKDQEMACLWMRRAAEEDPVRYTSDYCDMLVRTGDPEMQEEAIGFCRSQIAVRERPELCAALSRLHSSLDRNDSDREEAVRWMGRAASLDEGYERGYRDLLLASDDASDHKKAADICVRICRKGGTPDDWLAMSGMYRDGKGVPKDTKEAVAWMRKAVKLRPSQLSYDFCRLLQSSGDPEMEKEAFDIAQQRYAKTGSDMYLALMARAYRDGKGVPKDLSKAVECMQKAAKASPSRYLREYCELLMSTDRPEDHSEAHRICSGLYNKSGSPFSCMMLATMYRDGKGVPKDVSKAMEWFDKYSEASGGTRNSEYCEFILGSDDPGLHEKAWRLCNQYYSDTYDPEYCGLISRMYRDGKGVEKDLGKATEWMEKAYINDPGRWGAEFDDLLSRD